MQDYVRSSNNSKVLTEMPSYEMNESYLDNTKFIQFIEILLPQVTKMKELFPLAYMLFCDNYLTLLDGSFVNAIVFYRKSEFVNKLPLYTFNIQFMYDNLNFSFLLCNKLHLYFVTFLLTVSISNALNCLLYRFFNYSKEKMEQLLLIPMAKSLTQRENSIKPK